MTPQEAALQAVFARFAAAVQAADAAAYRSLTVADAPLEQALFLENAARVKARGWTLKLRALAIEGEVGVARFELVDSKGQRQDEGEATFTLENGGWQLRSL